MLGSVPLAPKALEDYRTIVGDNAMSEIMALAQALKGARVLHINATAFGGGVAEILSTEVPLMRDVGLFAEWQVIQGADEFFTITKAMHNSLQGMAKQCTPAMWDIWREYNCKNAAAFEGDYDFVIVHDPQPAALRQMVEAKAKAMVNGKWIWRCHLDLTEAQVEVWEVLRPYIQRYDAAVFSLEDYVQHDLTGPRIFVIPPAIDPLCLKNIDLPDSTVQQVLARYEVDSSRPMISQVSRFDPWKDPLGVIDAYRLVTKNVPDLQLVMVASMAHDDPEGWAYYERTLRRAGEDFDIHVLTNLQGVGSVEVNCFQRASAVVVQKLDCVSKVEQIRVETRTSLLPSLRLFYPSPLRLYVLQYAGP